MKKMKKVNNRFYVLCRESSPQFRELFDIYKTCRLCRIPGHPEVDSFIYGDRGNWVIYEGKTGLNLGFGKTQKDVIATVKGLIEQAEKEENPLRNQVEVAIKKHGLSPRWTD